MDKLPYKKVLDIDVSAFYDSTLSYDYFNDSFIRVESKNGIINEYFNETSDLYIFNNLEEFNFDTFEKKFINGINIKLREDIRIECTLSDEKIFEVAKCMSEYIDYDLDKSPDSLLKEIMWDVENAISNGIIPLNFFIEHDYLFDIELDDFVEDCELYYSYGYSQGDVARIIIPYSSKFEDDESKTDTNKFNKKQLYEWINKLLWDAPIYVYVRIGEKQYIGCEIIDVYGYWKDEKQKFIEYILDDNKKLSNEELVILKETLYSRLPEDLEYPY